MADASSTPLLPGGGTPAAVRLADVIRSAWPSLLERGSPPSAGAGSSLLQMAATASAAESAGRAAVTEEAYSELNLNRYPFTSLWTKDSGKRGSIVVRHTIKAGAESQLFEWIVTAGGAMDKSGGLPGPFDRKVFRAVENIVLGRTIRRGKPFTNPQEIQVKRVLQCLGLTSQTNNYRAVARSLCRLQSTQISCSGQMKSKKGSAAHGIQFSPISEIRWAGEVDRDTGVILRRTQLYFSPFYIDSVNSYGVRPIDWDLWLALGKRPLAQRLYELLEMRFYGLRNSDYCVFPYSLLCQLLPTRPQKTPRVAMHTLDRAHEMLKAIAVHRKAGSETVRLLGRVEWEWDGEDGRVKYYPHPDYLARLRERRTAEVDPRAVDLANEFHDLDSLSFYQFLVKRVDWQYLAAARSEVRCNARIREPAKYFSATLRAILGKAGLDVPFGSGRR